jgi:hypothetical protein
MQAIRAGRGPLTLTALVTLALGGAALLHRPAAPRVVEPVVVRVELRTPPSPPVMIDRMEVPVLPPEEPRCCSCIMRDQAEAQARQELEAKTRAKAKRRAASTSRR